jgi:O-antigen ligase
MPSHITTLIVLYFAVVVISFFRMLLDRRGLPPAEFTTATMWSEYLINTVKWVVPGLLVFDGCRTPERQRLAAWSIAGIYFLLAVQVIKWMPLEFASSEDMASRAAKIMLNEIGYSRVTMSMMLGGGAWACLSLMPLVSRWRFRLLLLVSFAAVAYAQALTGGRMGYVTWAVVGILLGLLRWRRYLLMAPLLLVLVAMVVPSAVERMLQGFTTSNGGTVVNDYEVTSGRNIAWPLVIKKIAEAPVVGYGEQAMWRTGLAAKLGAESFSHPHNAYLELLLDNGWMGFLAVVPFFFLVVWRAVGLLRTQDNLCTAIGGMTLALVLALLVAGVGSQTFYPQDDGVGMWAAIGVMLRVSVEKRKALEGGLCFEDNQGATGAGVIGQGRLGKSRRRVAAAAYGSWAARRRRPELGHSVLSPLAAERPPAKWPRTRLRVDGGPNEIRRFGRTGRHHRFT